MTKIPEYVNRLSHTIVEDVANGTFWYNITDEHTHANSRHVGMTSKGMLERMFKDSKPQVSAFNRDGGIREMTSDVTTIILRPDGNSKYGFRLITAFPEMSAESAHETGRDLTDICRQTEVYRYGTETCRAYMMAATDEIPKGFSIAYHPADRGFPDSLSVSFPSNNSGAEHCVYIDEISMNMRTYTYTSDNKRVSAPCTVGEKPCKRLDLTDEVNMAMFMDQYPNAARYMPNVNIPSGSDLQTDKDFGD